MVIEATRKTEYTTDERLLDRLAMHPMSDKTC